MNIILKNSLIVILFLLVLSALYFSWLINYDAVGLLSTLFITLLLGYHYFFDAVKSNLFIKVLSLFIVSGIVSSIFVYTEQKYEILANVSSVIAFLAYLLITLRLVKDIKFKTLLSKHILFIILIGVSSSYFIYKISAFLIEYSLGFEHIIGFIVVMSKVILLCTGLIYYLGKHEDSDTKMLLALSFTFFFLSQLSILTQLMTFPNKAVVALSILEAGFLLTGFTLFYFYCIQSEINKN